MVDSRLLSIGMIVIFVGATSTVVIASDVITPRPFCPVCESTSGPSGESVTLESALNEGDTEIATIEESTLELQLFPDGSVVWTAHNTLSSPKLAARLRDNTTFRETVLDRIEFEDTPVGQPHNLSLRVRNNTAIVRFTDPDGGSQRIGGILFLTAHKTTNDIAWELNADSVTLSGPSGWVVAQAPGGLLRDYRIVNETIVWQRTSGEETAIGDINPWEAYAFAPSHGVGPTLFTDLHRVLGAIPAATLFLLQYGSLPAIVLLIGFVLLGRGVHWRVSRDRPVALRRQSVGVVGLGLVASLASTLYQPLIGVGLVYLFIGGCGYLIGTADEPASPRLLAGVAAIAIVLATIVWMIVFGFERDSVLMEVQALAMGMSALSVLALSLPFGAFWQSGERYTAPLLIVIPYVLLVVAAGAPSFPQPPAGFAVGVFTVTSLLGVLAGSPLAYLGASLSQSHL